MSAAVKVRENGDGNWSVVTQESSRTHHLRSGLSHVHALRLAAVINGLLSGGDTPAPEADADKLLAEVQKMNCGYGVRISTSTVNLRPGDYGVTVEWDWHSHGDPLFTRRATGRTLVEALQNALKVNAAADQALYAALGRKLNRRVGL